MRRLLLFLLAALSLMACTQNEVEELTANRADAPETLTVGFEGADDETRVQLQNSKTVWTKGDEVSVFYFSNANQRWQFQGETGERTGKLKRLESAEATAETTYNVVAYPYDSNYFLNPRTCALHATLPATQHYAVDSYGAGGNIMVAQSEFTQFSLKNVCGWLRVELTGKRHIVNSITLRGNAGEQVAGLIYVDTATAEATLAAEMGEASDEEEVGGVGGGLEFDDTVFTEVTLDCGDGVELGAEATAFYVALLPQTFEKGMTIDINYANAEPQTLVCENSITISRNHISPIGIEANVEVEIPTNQLWYTATALVEPYDTSAFNVAIVSNEWDEATGEGIITFDGELTTIGDFAFYYCDSLTSVTIGDSVTTIGNWAFAFCSRLISVTIPDSVTTIGEEAFSYCYSLTSVTIGDSVTTIGSNAFSDCTSLTSVTIPDSVTTIGSHAFGYCSSLTSVTIPDSVTTIGGYAFCNCDSLTSVTIPDSVTTIGGGVFGGCSKLAEFKGKFAADGGRCLIKDNAIIAYAEASDTTYTIPDYVTTIGDGAFDGCNSLTSVTIPDSVTTIGWSAFSYCTSLTSVTIPDSVTTIGYGVFRNCSSLTSVYCKATTPPHIDSNAFNYNSTDRKIYVYEECVDIYKAAWSEYADSIVADGNIPESVTTTILYTTSDEAVIDASKFPVKSHTYNNGVGELIVYGELKAIPDRAFYEFGTFTTITIPDSVTTIGEEAFSYCYSLTSVTIPNSVTTIGDYAFEGCGSLTSVTIPDSVTMIGRLAFNGCSNLAEFKGKFAADGGRCLIKDNTLIAYAEASGTTYTIPDSVTTIGEYAFAYCADLTSVTIPDSVTTIGAEAFYACNSLTSVTIGDSVTTIGGGAFEYCTSLTSVTIHDSVTTIGNWAFFYCSSLTSVTIGNSVTTIGNSAFSSCSSLTSVTIPDSITTIGNSAFAHCGSLTSVTIPDSVTTIGDGVFGGCIKLAEFKGKFAADGGRCLIKDNTIIAYAEASGTTYTIPDSVTTIGNEAFYNCRSLTSVTIPDSVTTIGGRAFEYCTSLTSVTIPDSVTTIGGYAFEDCLSLTSVYCKAITPPSLGYGAFMYYDNGDVNIGCPIYVPAESVEEYKAAANWSEYAADIVGYDFETGEVVE